MDSDGLGILGHEARIHVGPPIGQVLNADLFFSFWSLLLLRRSGRSKNVVNQDFGLKLMSGLEVINVLKGRNDAQIR